MRMVSLVGASFIAVALSACDAISDLASGPKPPPNSFAAICAEKDGVATAEAWMRAAKEGQPVSAAYLTLANCGSEDDVLTGISFDGAASVELHATTVSPDGVTSMTKIVGVPLLAGEKVLLEPGGGHIMLMGVTEDSVAGELKEMTLEFEKREPLTVRFRVRDAMDADGHQGH